MHTVTHYCNHKDCLDAHTQENGKTDQGVSTQRSTIQLLKGIKKSSTKWHEWFPVYTVQEKKKKQRVFIEWYTLCKKKKQMWENTHGSACFVRKQKTSHRKRLIIHGDRGDGGWGGAGGVKGALTFLSIPFQITSGFLEPQSVSHSQNTNQQLKPTRTEEESRMQYNSNK